MKKLFSALGALLVIGGIFLIQVAPVSAADTGWHTFTMPPVSSSGVVNPSGALSDDIYATFSNGGYEVVDGFGFAIPAGATILGIEVQAEAHASDSDDTNMYFTAALSWDGTTYTTAQGSNAKNFLIGADQTKVIAGGTGDTWGRTWTVAQLNSATNFRVRITAVTVDSPILLDYLTVRVTYTLSPVVITSSPLPGGEVNAAYTTTLTATGGTTPYTGWAITAGSLPAGLGISTVIGNGVISGTPTVSGDFSFTVTVTDAASDTGTKAFNLHVQAAPSITTTSLPSGEKAVPYSQTVLETGGTAPFAWSIGGLGMLPPGLTLNPATGAITGTPTTSGIFNFTVQLVDSFSITVTRSLSISIGPYITTTSLANAGIGSYYNWPVQAVGGTTPYTWSIIGGLLPPGLALNPTTGVITGYVGNYGTYVFTVRVTDSLGSPYSPQTDTRTLSITVDGALLTVNIPNGGESWAIGSTQTITWTSTGYPVQSLVNIQISRDGGLTWTYIYYAIFNNPNSSNSMTWTVTGPAGTNNLIRISAFYNGYIYDVSDAQFTITTAAPPPT